MTIGLHHVIEGDFQHNLWLDRPPEALIFNCVFEKPLRHLGNLGIGQSRIRFTNIHQAVFMHIPHGKCVVAEHAYALAVTKTRRQLRRRRA